MENSLSVRQPIALARPRGAHRFEAFSPKLGRRVTFYRQSALHQWVLLEADPAVETFCERPGYVLNGERKVLADFWIRFAFGTELVILCENEDDVTEISVSAVDVSEFSLRRVETAELAASRIWIGNWLSMLPCLVANRRLITRSRSDDVLRFLDSPKKLADIEREFLIGDPVLVRATLFKLLHLGRVGAPELHAEPLSLRTFFVVTETAT